MSIAATMPACGNVSLSTQLNFLGKRLSNVIDINPKGWLVAQRVKLNDGNSEIAKSRTSSNKQHFLAVTTCPIILKVDMNLLVGKGSMRKA